MFIKTSDTNLVNKIFKKFILPKSNSHKGENGKVLIIGGSSLFHAASLWAAEVCSHFADIVHYSSTLENQKIFYQLKKTFKNGIIVKQEDLDFYLDEDDVILIGPGMMREGKEGNYSRILIKKLIKKFPNKKFVFDAGSLQVMDKEWLLRLKEIPILTPHKAEFEKLFKKEANEENLKKMANKYRSTILMKSIKDFVSNGQKTIIIEGGNQGLTKGGTGDVLAGLTASFYIKNQSIDAAIYASILLKKTADELFNYFGYWYNVNDIINKLPEVLKKLVL